MVRRAVKKRASAAETKSSKRPAAKQARGGRSVAERWRLVEAWLRENQPGALKEFRSPAPAGAVAKAEEALGRSLPDDYKAFLAIHDGQEVGGPMVEWATLLPVEDIAEQYASLVSLDPGADEGEEEIEYETDGKVKAIFYSPAWIPIGRSPRGRDFLCLDFDPPKRGKPGQVILFVTDFSERCQVAPSFADLLSVFLKEAKAGEIEF
jgi:cell wall assembly regulator SMI1